MDAGWHKAGMKGTPLPTAGPAYLARVRAVRRANLPPWVFA
ncbi:hypothetical protein RLIN73S_04234 [Rhodanobacter lindaniclasticus]